MSEDKNYEEFINGLTELSKKHNIFIGGCGCCCSPWLTGAVDKDDLHYDEEKGKYVAW